MFLAFLLALAQTKFSFNPPTASVVIVIDNSVLDAHAITANQVA